MSYNLTLRMYFEREVTVNFTGETSVQRVDYRSWSTPSAITENIEKNQGKFAELYKEYVLSLNKEITVPIQEFNNPKNKPVETTTLNLSLKEHDHFDSYCAYMKEQGYKLKFYTTYEEVYN